jgi:hypothetical protein
MLARVQKLEAARVTPKSPFEVAYGSMDAFADKVNADIGAGKLDSRDMPLVLAALHRWHKDRVWTGWQHHRNGMWDCR